MSATGTPQGKPVVWNNPALVNEATVTPLGTNSYRVSMPKRADGGYRAFYLDLEIEMADGGKFSSSGDNTINFSTPAMVIPDGFGLETCMGTACENGLMLLA